LIYLFVSSIELLQQVLEKLLFAIQLPSHQDKVKRTILSETYGILLFEAISHLVSSPSAPSLASSSSPSIPLDIPTIRQQQMDYLLQLYHLLLSHFKNYLMKYEENKNNLTNIEKDYLEMIFIKLFGFLSATLKHLSFSKHTSAIASGPSSPDSLDYKACIDLMNEFLSWLLQSNSQLILSSSIIRVKLVTFIHLLVNNVNHPFLLQSFSPHYLFLLNLVTTSTSALSTSTSIAPTPSSSTTTAAPVNIVSSSSTSTSPSNVSSGVGSSSNSPILNELESLIQFMNQVINIYQFESFVLLIQSFPIFFEKFYKINESFDVIINGLQITQQQQQTPNGSPIAANVPLVLQNEITSLENDRLLNIKLFLTLIQQITLFKLDSIFFGEYPYTLLPSLPTGSGALPPTPPVESLLQQFQQQNYFESVCFFLYAIMNEVSITGKVLSKNECKGLKRMSCIIIHSLIINWMVVPLHLSNANLNNPNYSVTVNHQNTVKYLQSFLYERWIPMILVNLGSGFLLRDSSAINNPNLNNIITQLMTTLSFPASFPNGLINTKDASSQMILNEIANLFYLLYRRLPLNLSHSSTVNVNMNFVSMNIPPDEDFLSYLGNVLQQLQWAIQSQNDFLQLLRATLQQPSALTYKEGFKKLVRSFP
jgi:hypothetical protein